MKIIPLLNLKLQYEHMKQDIDSAITRCLEHQKWILGPEVSELENCIAGYIGVKNCIGVSSGTEALLLSLRALAIKLKDQDYFDRTDEIITTPFTFTATGDAILRSGATPVFVDTDPLTYNINPENIRKYLSEHVSGCKVVGILPVHLYGLSCDMDEIMKIAKEYNLFVVEDVAQAFGGNFNGSKVGSIGAAGAFSFFPAKILGGFGDGGMVASNDDKIAELVRMLLKHGGKDKYNVDHIGYNARLDTLQAAILLAKFKYVEEFSRLRSSIAETYIQELADIDGIDLPVSDTRQNSKRHIFHQFTIKISNGKRDDLQNYLKENGISTMIYYPVPLHNMKVFSNGRNRTLGGLPNSIESSNSVLSLPIEPLQSIEETIYVVNAIKRFFRTPH